MRVQDSLQVLGSPPALDALQPRTWMAAKGRAALASGVVATTASPEPNLSENNASNAWPPVLHFPPLYLVEAGGNASHVSATERSAGTAKGAVPLSKVLSTFFCCCYNLLRQGRITLFFSFLERFLLLFLLSLLQRSALGTTQHRLRKNKSNHMYYSVQTVFPRVCNKLWPETQRERERRKEVFCFMGPSHPAQPFPNSLLGEVRHEAARTFRWFRIVFLYMCIIFGGFLWISSF